MTENNSEGEHERRVRALEERLRWQESHDTLTGLLSIRAFRESSGRIMDSLRNYERRAAALYLDLQDFKTVNELYGFEEGDCVLKEVGSLFQRAFPERLCARLAGNHFITLCFEDEVERGLRYFSEELKKGSHPELSYRAGVYIIPGEDADADAILACDRAKLAADSLRGQFGNSCRFFNYELDERLKKQKYIADTLEHALEAGWISVHYQPVIRTLTGKICGAEALSRWEDPRYGNLSPKDYIEVLEKTGLISRLDCFVIETVCRTHRELMDRGEPRIPISMNFSRVDFELMDMISFLEEQVQKYRVPKNLINIEITESAIPQNPELIRRQISRLRKAGYQVWMDDFGSGYSSLNILKNFEFDELKIDMLFLKDMD